MIIELIRTANKKSKRDENDTFNILSFVLRARSSDPTRYILHYLSVESIGDEKTVVCTDGRRLHYAEHIKGLNLTDGMYRVLKVTPYLIWLDLKPDAGTYPAWRQVLPKDGDTKLLTINLKDEPFKFCVKVHEASKGGYYNLKYLLESMPPFQTAAELSIKAVDSLSPIQITHKYGSAVVMPMRTS